MGKMIVYGMPVSCPTRSVLLTLKALNIPYEFKIVNFVKRENLSPEYLRINPVGTVPALEDDDCIILDSHAIIAYLANKYGKDDANSLYPKDPYSRSVVDHRLYYEACAIFERIIRPTSVAAIIRKKTNIPQSQIDNIEKAYETVDNFLMQTTYVAADHLTIADFSLIPSITSLAAFLEVDAVKYPQLSAWVKKMEELPYYAEANGEGCGHYKAFFNSKTFKIVPGYDYC